MTDLKTTQPALLLKDAYKAREAASKTVLVSANGSVTFMPLHGVDAPIQLTVEQWNELVEFVDNALLADREMCDEAWQPDWSAIDERFRYVAADKDGSVWAYELEPDAPLGGTTVWCNGGGGTLDILDIKAPAYLNWRKSLRVRPGR